MWFLFFQIWLWLLAAFTLGWIAHWFFCCRDKNETDVDTSQEFMRTNPNNTTTGVSGSPVVSQVDTSSVDTDTSVQSVAVDESWKPMLFSTAPAKVDELKRIKGVGQVLEKTLHDLGVYQFQQIADWSDEHVKWMDNFLSFTGRIDREDWRSQAKILAQGGETEFAKRVDKGDVDY